MRLDPSTCGSYCSVAADGLLTRASSIGCATKISATCPVKRQTTHDLDVAVQRQAKRKRRKGLDSEPEPESGDTCRMKRLFHATRLPASARCSDSRSALKPF